MDKFEDTYTWDRSSLPAQVNSFLDDLLSARHKKQERDRLKGKFLRENAPVYSLAEWRNKYAKGNSFEDMVINNTTKVSKEALRDSSILEGELAQIGMGLKQYLQQAGIKQPDARLVKGWQNQTRRFAFRS